MSTPTPVPAPILVFDVNETLLDLGHLEPFFTACFGDARAMREWFAEHIMFSQSLTLAGHYLRFSELAVASLRMRASIHDITLTPADIDAFTQALQTLPALPDVAPALVRLQKAGYRLVTLTNSCPGPNPSPLERAGIAHYFEHAFSVHAVEQFKPASACYTQVLEALEVKPADLCLVACHIWDTLGASAIGMQSAFIARPGNALLPGIEIAKPTYVASDLGDLADQWLP